MTTPFDRLSLLDAMDVAADLLRATNCNYSVADDQIVFRRLQKERLPGLDREQFQTLFAEWQERYAAKAVQDQERAVANIMATIEEYAKKNPPSPARGRFSKIAGILGPIPSIRFSADLISHFAGERGTIDGGFSGTAVSTSVIDPIR